MFYIDNYAIEAPAIDILERVKLLCGGTKLKDIKPGTESLTITCPCHKGGREQKPACHVHIGQDSKVPYGYAYCFVCGFRGPFEQLIAACFNSSVDYAKKWLIDTYGEKVTQIITLDPPINLSKPKQISVLDKTILDTYQSWCPYFATRKLDPAVCEKFNVKYDAENRRIVFPIFDKNNNLIALPARSVDSKVFFLDKLQNKPVYCLDYIIKNNITKVVITEGPIDCLTAYGYGYDAIATLGSPSYTQIDAINHSGIKVLYLCMDNDEAGKQFTATLKKKLNKNILTFDVILPKNRKDINETTMEEFKKCMENAV